MAESLFHRPRRLLRALAAMLAATFLVCLFTTLLVAAGLGGTGGTGVTVAVRDSTPALAYLLVTAMVGLRALRVRQARAAWAAIAIGVSLSAAGNIVFAALFDGVSNPPVPSIADAFFLPLYPAAYLGIVLLAREDRRRKPAGAWLDGIVAGLGIAAVGAAVVFHQVLASASGDHAAIITSLAYPIADLLLAALVVGLLASRGWRLTRVWALLGGGFLILSLADSITLIDAANGITATNALANAFYISTALLVALAAWQRPGAAEAPRLAGRSVLLAPAVFVLGALGLLVTDHYHRLDDLAIVLAVLTVAAGFVRAALTFRDLRDIAEARHQAVTDDLTGLPNRRLFLRRLEEATTAARASDQPLALLIIDLDHFKQLNDTLGHQAGDELLCQIGPRLNSVLRPTDTLARLGGDEFGLVLGPPSGGEAAMQVVDRVRRELGRPFEVKELHLELSASVGIALFPEHGELPDELHIRADAAMYQAKADRTGHGVYERERDKSSPERLALIGELRHALRNGELEAHFQPKVSVSDRRVVGAEALVRWRHPKRGLLSPALFLPLAEQTGLARPLTRRMLDQALRQLRAWLDDGLDMHVSVNVTATDLLDAKLPIEVGDALERHGVAPSALVIEITETSVLSDPVRIGEVLGRLDDLGVGLSLDDFGTGYSSLTHLRTLPVCEVKIDRSFVGRMDCDDNDRAIVSSTIGLSHDLGKRVVAEGIEDEATWRQLEALGCELMQGYAFAPPLLADELAPLLESARRTPSPAPRGLGLVGALS